MGPSRPPGGRCLGGTSPRWVIVEDLHLLLPLRQICLDWQPSTRLRHNRHQQALHHQLVRSVQMEMPLLGCEYLLVGPVCLLQKQLGFVSFELLRMLEATEVSHCLDCLDER